MAANQTGIIQTGILPSATPVIIATPKSMQLPGSITLKSAAAGRLIELSTDGGTEYFGPLIDISTATMQIIVVNAPITHIRLTGTTADTYVIS